MLYPTELRALEILTVCSIKTPGSSCQLPKRSKPAESDHAESTGFQHLQYPLLSGIILVRAQISEDFELWLPMLAYGHALSLRVWCGKSL